MAWITARYYSRVLGASTSMEVLLPEADDGIGIEESPWDGKSDLPVLYLLHGWGDDCTMWMRRTSIERYAAGRRLAIVMPSFNRSMHANSVHGRLLFKALCEEVPQTARRYFKISDKRSENFIAGLSMGGYGAMKAALTHPEQYIAVASMSGGLDLDIVQAFQNNDLLKEKSFDQYNGDERRGYHFITDFTSSFKSFEEYKNSDANLNYLLERQVKNNADLPAMHISVGTEDFLYNTNVIFKNKLDELNVPYEYMEEPGVHEWGLWDKYIKIVLDWLPI